MPRAVVENLVAVGKAIDLGLDKAAALAIGRGEFEAIMGFKGDNFFGRLETVWRPNPTTSLYGYGEAKAMPGFKPSFEAGIGARVKW